MREELRGIAESDYWVYGLSIEDFDYTFRIADDFAGARRELLEQYEQRVRREQPDEADAVLDDMYYYTWIETQYLWHFCLWRLQAILEGIISHTMLDASVRRVRGLRARLDALREAGYTLPDDEYEELLAWATLRNALSHAPPERYRPGPLTKEDVMEYKELCQQLCEGWMAEQAAS